MVTARRLLRKALLFAGPRDGEETLLEVCDDQWPELLPDDCGHYRLDAAAGTRGRNRSAVYRWVPPTTKPGPSDKAKGKPR